MLLLSSFYYLCLYIFLSIKREPCVYTHTKILEKMSSFVIKLCQELSLSNRIREIKIYHFHVQRVDGHTLIFFISVFLYSSFLLRDSLVCIHIPKFRNNLQFRYK